MKIFSYPVHQDDFKELVIKGLSEKQKVLAPKFFYDQKGSELFEQIVSQPEYYIPEIEKSMLKEHAPEIDKLFSGSFHVVEYGSGASQKIRILLDGLRKKSDYVAIDIAESFLKESCEALERDYPDLKIYGICADFFEDIKLPEEVMQGDEELLVFFPGSTIGNLYPEEASTLLSKMKNLMGSKGKILIGVDLVKDETTLLAAYNDARGITAQFNLNILSRIKNELGAELELSHFDHRSVFNKELARIEMHLVANQDTIISLDGEKFELKTGEFIHTENSHKYTKESFSKICERAGLRQSKFWTDDKNYFSLQILENF